MFDECALERYLKSQIPAHPIMFKANDDNNTYKDYETKVAIH